MGEDIARKNIREENCSAKAKKKSRAVAWTEGIAYFVLVTGVILYKADDWFLTEEDFILLEAAALGIFLLEKLVSFLYWKWRENIRAGKKAALLMKSGSYRGNAAILVNSGNYRRGADRAARKRQLHLRLAFVALGCIAAALIAALGVRYVQVQSYIPDSLLEFAEKYPQAKTFVEDYPKKKNLDVTIDLTDEVTAGEIPLFIQWDERWGYKIYGSDCMGVTGCGPTCISMLVCGLTGNLEWNPYKTAQFAEDQGYYVYGSGTSWKMMTEGAQALGLQAEAGTVSANYIRQNLTSETPLIASMTPGDFTYTGHFIVLTGLDAAGNVTVNDPNSPANSAKTWSVDTLVSQMAAVWKYSAE